MKKSFSFLVLFSLLASSTQAAVQTQPLALNEAYRFMDASTFYAPTPGTGSSSQEAEIFLKSQRSWGHLYKLTNNILEVGSTLALIGGTSTLADRSQSKTLQSTGAFLNAQIGFQSGIGESLLSGFKTVFKDMFWHNIKEGCHFFLGANYCPTVSEEPLKPYELRLIQDWHKLPESLRQRLAFKLFSIQRGEESYSNNLEFLEGILKSPTNSQLLSFDSLELQKTLKGYDLPLQKTMLGYAFGRFLQSRRYAPMKNHLFFLGRAGTGKTHLASAIPEALNAPYCEIDMSPRLSLLGTTSQMSPITQCMLDTGVVNPILILNDIDRVLNAEGGALHMQALLKITDTQATTLHDPYMGIKYNTSQVSFIFTGNEFIFERKDDKNVPSEAFYQRVNLIEFKGFTPEYRREIIESAILPKLISRYPELQLTLEDFSQEVERWYQNQIQFEKAYQEQGQDYDRGMRVPEVYFETLFPQLALQKLTAAQKLNDLLQQFTP